MWRFLTWPFLLAQVMYADALFGNALHAAPDQDDTGGDHAASHASSALDDEPVATTSPVAAAVPDDPEDNGADPQLNFAGQAAFDHSQPQQAAGHELAGGPSSTPDAGDGGGGGGGGGSGGDAASSGSGASSSPGMETAAASAGDGTGSGSVQPGGEVGSGVADASPGGLVHPGQLTQDLTTGGPDLGEIGLDAHQLTPIVLADAADVDHLGSSVQIGGVITIAAGADIGLALDHVLGPQGLGNIAQLGADAQVDLGKVSLGLDLGSGIQLSNLVQLGSDVQLNVGGGAVSLDAGLSAHLGIGQIGLDVSATPGAVAGVDINHILGLQLNASPVLGAISAAPELQQLTTGLTGALTSLSGPVSGVSVLGALAPTADAVIGQGASTAGETMPATVLSDVTNFGSLQNNGDLSSGDKIAFPAAVSPAPVDHLFAGGQYTDYSITLQSAVSSTTANVIGTVSGAAADTAATSSSLVDAPIDKQTSGNAGPTASVNSGATAPINPVSTLPVNSVATSSGSSTPTDQHELASSLGHLPIDTAELTAHSLSI